MSPTLAVTLACRLDEVPRLLALIEEFGGQAGLGEDLVFRLSVTLDEAVTNVVRHGSAAGAGRDIQLTITVADDVVTAIVRDEGQPFDPLTVPEPDLDAPADQRPIGGLGVHLMRSLTRSLAYRRDRDRNVLTLTFDRGPATS